MALARAGITWDDVSCRRAERGVRLAMPGRLGEWPELDPEKVNPNGGAIAIGPPARRSGVRILGTLAHELRRRGGGYGVAALCIGVGQGLAVVLEA